MRVISFRHEQHAGNAAAIAGFLTSKPGICLTVSAPGFLNGLTALANATTNCFPMILISGSSEREIVDLQQGDYEEMDQLAIAKPLCKAAFRVLHAEDIGIGIARAIRSAVSGRPGGVYLDLPAKLFAQAIDAAAGKRSLVKVVDPAPRQLPAPDAVQRALDVLKGAKRPLIILGKGAAYAQADAEIRALIEKTGIPYLPMCMAKGLLPDTHPQSARGGALERAGRGRRRDADRRAPELAALARQGQDLGRRQRRRAQVHPDRHRADRDGQQRRDRRAAGRRHRLVRRGAGRRHRRRVGQARRPNGPARSASARRRTSPRWPRRWPRTRADGLPQRAQRDPRRRQGATRTRSSSTRAPTRSTSRARSSTCTSRASASTSAPGASWASAWASPSPPRSTTGKPVIAIEGDSAFGFSGMEVETICRYDLPVCVVVFNNNGIYRGTDVNPRGGDVAPTVFVKGARYDKMMEAFGGVGVNATTPDELQQRLNEAMDSGKPTLINAVIDETAGTESGRIASLNPTGGQEEVTRALPIRSLRNAR